jgi:hypothetical protein
MATTKKTLKRNVRPLTADELDPERTPFLSPRRLYEAGFGDHDTLLEAVKTGTIPSIRYQRNYRIPTRWVRQALGLEPEAAAL